MTALNLSDPTNGTTADANLIAANNAAIKAVVNGSLDNANIASGADLDGAKFLNGSVKNSKLVQAAGVLADMPPGRELTYNQIVADVGITHTTEATADAIVTASAFTFDGATPVLIEFFCPEADNGPLVQDNSLVFCLYDGAASIGEIAHVDSHVTVADTNHLLLPVYAKLRLTPSAAAHTYSIRAYTFATPATVKAGAGGLGALWPAYIRITKV